MNNVLIYRKLISLLELKLEEELKAKGNRSFQLTNDISYLLSFELQSERELRMLNKMLTMIFGYNFMQIKEQIHLEQNALRKEMNELDEYVESLKMKKDVSSTQNFIGAAEYFASYFRKIAPKTTIIDFGTSGNVDDSFEFEKLWNTHTEQNYLTEQMNIDLKLQGEIIEYSIHLDRLEKIKEIIPVINDNFILNKRLNELKKVEQRLKKLPKSQRGELVQIQTTINTIKSWL